MKTIMKNPKKIPSEILSKILPGKVILILILFTALNGYSQDMFGPASHTDTNSYAKIYSGNTFTQEQKIVAGSVTITYSALGTAGTLNTQAGVIHYTTSGSIGNGMTEGISFTDSFIIPASIIIAGMNNASNIGTGGGTVTGVYVFSGARGSCSIEVYNGSGQSELGPESVDIPFIIFNP